MIPPLPALLGAQFHQQWAIVDPKANTLGLVFANAGTGQVGV